MGVECIAYAGVKFAFMPTPWARYVKDITARAPQHEIAAVTHIAASVISRWETGRANRPRAVQVIQLARAYTRPPGEALVAAGYLEPGEWGPGVLTPVEGFTDEELVVELERYWIERQRLVIEMVSRFLGRRVEIEGPLPHSPGRRRTDPSRLQTMTDTELLDATSDLMAQRTMFMDEISRRLLGRSDDASKPAP
jgi:transcriptional regulator with XRE-family HTH domain